VCLALAIGVEWRRPHLERLRRGTPLRRPAAGSRPPWMAGVPQLQEHFCGLATAHSPGSPFNKQRGRSVGCLASRAGVPPRSGCSLRSHPGAARPGSCGSRRCGSARRYRRSGGTRPHPPTRLQTSSHACGEKTRSFCMDGLPAEPRPLVTRLSLEETHLANLLSGKKISYAFR
jgi:hypothetical protein